MSLTLSTPPASAAASGVRVCPPEHAHAGTTNCYHHHGCRCTPCSNRVVSGNARVRRLRAYGRWEPLVDATVARAHLRVLSAYGVGVRQVAALTGMSHAHLRDIRVGLTATIRKENHDRIRAVPVDVSSLAPSAPVPARGVHRRLQALHARGWTTGALAPHLGTHSSNVSRLLQQDVVTRRLHERVAAVYGRLWDVAPPVSNHAQRRESEKARRIARENGWALPIEWEDIDTDDAPFAEVPALEADVDVIAVDLAVHGHQVVLTRAERHLAVEQLHAAGHGDRLIAHMLLVDDRTILRDRKHLGLPANENPAQLDRRLVA